MISVPPLIPNNKNCTGIRKWHGIGENAAYFCAISPIIGHFNSINIHHHEKTAKILQRRKPGFHHPREHHPDVITPQWRGTRTAYPAVLSLRRTGWGARWGTQPCRGHHRTGEFICGYSSLTTHFFELSRVPTTDDPASTPVDDDRPFWEVRGPSP